MWSSGEALAALLVCLLVIQTTRLAWLRRRPGRRLRARQRRAMGAEREAQKLLERQGYSIELVQPVARADIEVDDEPVTVEVRADLIVSKRGRRFVAEIKSGKVVSKVASRATRRQLLEYCVAYDVDGVLLVDMELERVHRVSFPLLPVRSPPGSVLAVTVLAVLAAVLSIWLALR